VLSPCDAHAWWLPLRGPRGERARGAARTHTYVHVLEPRAEQVVRRWLARTQDPELKPGSVDGQGGWMSVCGWAYEWMDGWAEGFEIFGSGPSMN
jgi:hypothetical protein